MTSNSVRCLPPCVYTFHERPSLVGVDGHDDALASEILGTYDDELGIMDRGGIDGYLVRSSVQGLPHILFRTDASADR